MIPLEAPMWPDFRVDREDDSPMWEDLVMWRGTTTTMRPPIKNGKGQRFSVTVLLEPADQQDSARLWLQRRFDNAYRSAHPNGCA